MAKQCNSTPHIILPEGARQLREILSVRQHRNGPKYMTCGKLAGSSHDISTGAQRAAGFRSVLEYGPPERFAQLFDGTELDAWRERQR
jgi:hypothetical protein